MYKKYFAIIQFLCIDVHMVEDFRSHKQVLELWRRLAPGKRRFHAALAADLGLPSQNVARWYYRDSVPPKYWPRLLDLAEQRFNVIITPRQMMLAAAGQQAQPSDKARSEAA